MRVFYLYISFKELNYFFFPYFFDVNCNTVYNLLIYEKRKLTLTSFTQIRVVKIRCITTSKICTLVLSLPLFSVRLVFSFIILKGQTSTVLTNVSFVVNWVKILWGSYLCKFVLFSSCMCLFTIKIYDRYLYTRDFNFCYSKY